MYKCFRCGAEFEQPERIVIGIHQDEILIVCPKCGDDRITYLWDDNPKGKEKEKEE